MTESDHPDPSSLNKLNVDDLVKVCVIFAILQVSPFIFYSDSVEFVMAMPINTFVMCVPLLRIIVMLVECSTTQCLLYILAPVAF